MLPGDASAQEILLREGQTNTLPGTFTVPFAFYSGSLGSSVGASIGNRGFFQPQASAFAAVVGSANDSDLENFITGEGADVKVWRSFGYILQMGSGAEDPKLRLVLRDGIAVKVGRVAEEFDLGTLHTYMKLVGLVGLRAMVNTWVVRADVGISAEGGQV